MIDLVPLGVCWILHRGYGFSSYCVQTARDMWFVIMVNLGMLAL